MRSSVHKAPSTVGMMEGAFFVGRAELLSWVNDTFCLNLTKVEQCSNGAVYCSVIDSCNPGKVAMRKVNWMARNDPELIANYKTLQQAFDKCGIEKHIEVDKLIRGKYQDNLEMLQWMKCYFDNTFSAEMTYDAEKVRQGIPLPEWASASFEHHQGDAAKENIQPRASLGGGEKKRGGGKIMPRQAAAGLRHRGLASPGYSGGTAFVPHQDRLLVEELREQSELQKEEIVDLKITVDGLESERDYYFRKLRDIEILCQTLEQGHEGISVQKLLEDVQTILYQKEEDEEQHDQENGSGEGVP